jgi:glyoxylase-like metal-dependent hydrolase (beta-lactamase superfamily II)
MHGKTGITGAFILRGERTALIESGPKTSVQHVLAGLGEAGIDRLNWIIVTHIHLDHAGAAGTLAGRFPEATVAVHEVGAPHLVDPSKLWKSAARIYGEDMDRLWGGIDPIPEDRIRPLRDGDEIDLGGRKLTAFDTPGHARHHHAYLDDATGILFCGDALGVKLSDIGIIRPATPPPEFHLGDAIDTIQNIKGIGADRLCLTHFGFNDAGSAPAGVSETCDAAVDALQQWERWVREARSEADDPGEVVALVEARARAELEKGLSSEEAERLEDTTSYSMNVAGYVRYLDKHEGATEGR